MKRFLATLMCLIVLTMAALPAGAQTRYDRYRNSTTWQKHRDKITTAGGALGGALIGGLIGGKKGAAVGAITGGGGAAVYTYKIRNRGRRY